MQGAMWLGTQYDPMHQPKTGDYQMSDVFSVFHLMVDGKKMSHAKGYFFTGDGLTTDKGYTADQLRYFVALLSLPETASNFDFAMLKERNKFLAGPMNGGLEKTISACHLLQWEFLEIAKTRANPCHFFASVWAEGDFARSPRFFSPHAGKGPE